MSSARTWAVRIYLSVTFPLALLLTIGFFVGEFCDVALDKLADGEILLRERKRR